MLTNSSLWQINSTAYNMDRQAPTNNNSERFCNITQNESINQYMDFQIQRFRLRQSISTPADSNQHNGKRVTYGCGTASTELKQQSYGSPKFDKNKLLRAFNTYGAPNMARPRICRYGNNFSKCILPVPLGLNMASQINLPPPQPESSRSHSD